MEKEQIKQVLQMLKDYSGWMYYSPNALEMVKNATFELEGYKCHLNITPEGLFEIIIEGFPDVKGVYNAMITTAPLTEQNGIENVQYQYAIAPESQIPDDFKEFFDNAGIFVMSYMQRAVAFTFFARMHEDTLDRIATELSKGEVIKDEPDDTHTEN